jgi:hypothetical protein
MKYVCLAVHLPGTIVDVPILFPDELVHAMVAGAMSSCLAKHYPGSQIYPVSAGEVTITRSPNGDDVSCSGASQTLGLCTRGEYDEALISGINYNKGIRRTVGYTAELLRKLKSTHSDS